MAAAGLVCRIDLPLDRAMTSDDALPGAASAPPTL